MSHTALAVVMGFPAAPAGGQVNGEDTWFGAYDGTAAHGGIGVADNTATGSTTQTGTSTDVVHYAGGNGATGTAARRRRWWRVRRVRRCGWRGCRDRWWHWPRGRW